MRLLPLPLPQSPLLQRAARAAGGAAGQRAGQAARAKGPGVGHAPPTAGRTVQHHLQGAKRAGSLGQLKSGKTSSRMWAMGKAKKKSMLCSRWLPPCPLLTCNQTRTKRESGVVGGALSGWTIGSSGCGRPCTKGVPAAAAASAAVGGQRRGSGRAGTEMGGCSSSSSSSSKGCSSRSLRGCKEGLISCREEACLWPR
ncbi:hypothetical protein DUNSADRAFT_9759 [Dunaliella salina]|uniref:Encoded protein n=1 Tax=Dunaliella salina TaxID=3046 RepID=A0ABQ7GGT3_DUNSA|nr:hypothetical protein DUNSADRAFT_9759 [Dunaliella salina]|eukprot:KAF5833814.1 hypothetical protein DUNSADRAFT_9759 [Dunaliella salina]